MRLGLPSHVCGVRVAHVTAFDCSAPALQVYAHNFPEDHHTTRKPWVQKASCMDMCEPSVVTGAWDRWHQRAQTLPRHMVPNNLGISGLIVPSG